MSKGVLIVVLALVLALLMAMGLNVTTHQETTTTYDFVADLTPVVEHGDVYTWTEYNPVTNWTGWTGDASWQTTANGVVNRYMIPSEIDHISTSFPDIPTLDWNRLSAAVSGDDQGAHFIVSGNGTYSNAQVDPNYMLTAGPDLLLLEAAGLLEDDTLWAEVVADVPCFLPLGSFRVVTATASPHDTSYAIRFAEFPVQSSTYPDLASRIVWNPDLRTWNAYDSYDRPLWATGDSTGAFIVQGGQRVSEWPTSGVADFSNSVTGSGFGALGQLKVTVYDVIPAEYLVIDDGITVSGSAVLDNGYENGSVTVLVEAGDNVSLIAGGFTTAITSSSSGITARVFPTASPSEAVERVVGTWPAVAVELDSLDDVVRLTPATKFDSFVSYTLSTYTIEIPAALSSIGSLTASGSATLGVVSTTIRTDPSNVLWQDPTLDPVPLFPTATSGDYSVWIRSVASYGDTMTINGQTFQISGLDIVVGEKTYPVSGMRVDYVGGNASLNWPSEREAPSEDLGAISDNEISATGVWYASMDLMTIRSDTRDAYDWDPDGWQKADGATVIALFMGICVAGLLILSRTSDIKAGDTIIVIASIALMWVVMGAVT